MLNKFVRQCHWKLILKFDHFVNLVITKCHKILDLSQHILDVVKSEKENKFHLTDQIKFKQVKFETCNNLYDINFGQLDKIKETKRTKVLVKS